MSNFFDLKQRIQDVKYTAWRNIEESSTGCEHGNTVWFYTAV